LYHPWVVEVLEFEVMFVTNIVRVEKVKMHFS
jgi:hypothetical protein